MILSSKTHRPRLPLGTEDPSRVGSSRRTFVVFFGIPFLRGWGLSSSSPLSRPNLVLLSPTYTYSF